MRLPAETYALTNSGQPIGTGRSTGAESNRSDSAVPGLHDAGSVSARILDKYSEAKTGVRILRKPPGYARGRRVPGRSARYPGQEAAAAWSSRARSLDRSSRSISTRISMRSSMVPMPVT